jgi:hypothetical protein
VGGGGGEPDLDGGGREPHLGAGGGGEPHLVAAENSSSLVA